MYTIFHKYRMRVLIQVYQTNVRKIVFCLFLRFSTISLFHENGSTRLDSRCRDCQCHKRFGLVENRSFIQHVRLWFFKYIFLTSLFVDEKVAQVVLEQAAVTDIQILTQTTFYENSQDLSSQMSTIKSVGK